MIEDSSPMPRPAPSTSGRSRARPPAMMPTGVTATAATPIAMASPDEPGKRRPVAALSRMYTAQQAAARSANASPARFSPAGWAAPAAGPAPRVSSATPIPASSTQTMSSRCRDAATATASGPRNSTVTAMPSGIRANDW